MDFPLEKRTSPSGNPGVFWGWCWLRIHSSEAHAGVPKIPGVPGVAGSIGKCLKPGSCAWTLGAIMGPWGHHGAIMGLIQSWESNACVNSRIHDKPYGVYIPIRSKVCSEEALGVENHYVAILGPRPLCDKVVKWHCCINFILVSIHPKRT